jgi:hypothetical protein
MYLHCKKDFKFFLGLFNLKQGDKLKVTKTEDDVYFFENGTIHKSFIKENSEYIEITKED